MNTQGGTRSSLVATVEAAGRRAFDPAGDDVTRAEGQREFSQLISRTGTPSLIPALNALIKPDRVPRWLRLSLMDILTLMPQRPDGVRATLEFVFASHPSSTVRTSEAADPQKQGANITLEALKMATGLLATPPASVSPEEWFSGMAPQLFDLLDGNQGPDLVKAAAYVIGYGILGRKQFGAPGSPGWKLLAEPMLATINPSLTSQGTTNDTKAIGTQSEQVVDLQTETTIVSPEELQRAIRRLTALLNAHPNPGLAGRLLAPLVLPLWALSSWPNPDNCSERFCIPSKTLLRIHLKISGSVEKYTRMMKGLLFGGGQLSDQARWKFELKDDSGIQIRRLRFQQTETISELDWSELEYKANAFVELLEGAAVTTDVSKLFLALLQRSFGRQNKTSEIQLLVKEEAAKDPTEELIESKILQTMLDKIPDKLIADSKGMLEMACRILADFCTAPENIEGAAVALSLLNLVVTAPTFQKSDFEHQVLHSIETSLETIDKMSKPDVSQTARNLSLLLRYRDEVDDPKGRPAAATDRQIEDRKTYNLALSYITQADSPPPVRSEGLSLVSGLMQANSPVLDVQGVLVLLSSLLTEDEDYINLQVMKMFVQVAEKHPMSATTELLEHYVDANEKANVDTRLRFGEAILQVVQRLGDTFAGDTATRVGESLLSIGGRRGHRPKTEAKQEREERLRRRQNRAAKTAWGGEVPDLSDEVEQTEEEKARDEILAQILQGWESKRGSEDVRMRASALSIFSVGMETNMAGLGATLVEASVDLCINILTMEPEMEKAIVRRAAIIVILTFVKALADAREHGRRLGFGLTDPSRQEIARILRYVSQTDSDGLVQQHARDVMESLENWQMTAMLPEVGDAVPAFTKIAGLGSVSMPKLEEQGPRAKPRIEEIE